jgi:hypothetical protein
MRLMKTERQFHAFISAIAELVRRRVSFALVGSRWMPGHLYLVQLGCNA